MRLVVAALSCALGLSACSLASPSASTTDQAKPKSTMTAAQQKTLEAQNTLASYDGYGSTRFGMNEAAFRVSWQADLVGTIDPAGDCSMLRPAWEKSMVTFDFMFLRGQFVRYDVGTANPVAPGGGKVGMDVAQIRALYGSTLQVSPHKFREKAQILRTTNGKGSVLIFETDADGKVSRWRMGIPPQIDNEDGCL
ncbi:lectin [Rhodanobacter sp. L36]|uniref:lectin n=1 Tax=Rhodanobacter sp. L36 TaxID=1747221 RepID=UPI00131D0E09|nr:lectin [Rhodanobacter sp. L36]